MLAPSSGTGKQWDSYSVTARTGPFRKSHGLSDVTYGREQQAE